jgi:hypothetical protein
MGSLAIALPTRVIADLAAPPRTLGGRPLKWRLLAALRTDAAAAARLVELSGDVHINADFPA